MNIKNTLKKTGVMMLSAALVFSAAPEVSEITTVYAANSYTELEVNSYVNKNWSSDDVVKYTPGEDVTGSGNALNIVIINVEDYNKANSTSISDSNIASMTTSTTGVVYTTSTSSSSNTEKEIQLSELNTSKTGDYTVYYKYAGSFDSKDFQIVEGPKITNDKFKACDDGFEMTYKCSNVDFNYEWEVYTNDPMSSNPNSVDSYSSTGFSSGEEIENSSNSLSDNTLTYYLVLKVTDNSTGAKYIYSDSASNKYHRFRLTSNNSSASGTNSDNSGSSSKTSTTSSSNKPVTKKVTNSDGSVTETVTQKSGTITTETRTTTWTDKTTKAVTRTHVIQMVKDTTTGTTNISDKDTASDGSYIETEAAYQKDNSYSVTDVECTAKGNKSIIKASYNSSGTLTALSESSASGSTTKLKTEYKVGSGGKLTVKKITSKKTSVEISDIATAVKVVKYSATEGIETDTVGYSVNGIGANALKSNKVVKKVMINSGIKTIGKNAFRNVKKLKTVELDGPLTSVGKKAFLGIDKKATISVSATNKKYKSTKKLIKNSGIAATVKIKQV